MATPGDWRDTLQPGERLAVQQKLCVARERGAAARPQGCAAADSVVRLPRRSMGLALQLLGGAAADKRAAVETASREFEQKVFDSSASRVRRRARAARALVAPDAPRRLARTRT